MLKVMESKETGSSRPGSVEVEVTGLPNNFEVPDHSTVINMHNMANFRESLGLCYGRA